MHPKSLLATLGSACLGSSPSSGPLMGKQWSVMKISMVNLKTNMKFKNTMQFLFLYVWRNHAESSSHESETKHNHVRQIVCNIPAELRKKDVPTGLHGTFLTHLGHIFTYLHQHFQEQTQLQPLQLLQHPRRVHVPLLVEMDLP